MGHKRFGLLHQHHTDLFKITMMIFAVYAAVCSVCFADDNRIVIDPGSEIGKVNPYVFGNNVLGHWSDYDPGNQFSDYGSGLWDPTRKTGVKDAIELAKKAGITALRFPGGCGAHLYDWKKAIGPHTGQFRFGIDEFLKICAEIDAEPIFTVSYFMGNSQDAADLIEYLNMPNDGSNPNGGRDWALLRAKNGHPQPYHVKYFEIGNETWHGNHADIKGVMPDAYAEKYLQYYDAMKSVDPSIQIGAILDKRKWNIPVLEKIKDRLDFGVLHTYPGAYMKPADLQIMTAQDIFRIILTNPEHVRIRQIQGVLDLMREKSQRTIPLAITEFNGGFRQEKPVPYRHCLGTALVNAEMLKILMQPANHILMANHWNFANEYWGMIANGFSGNPETLHKPYFQRPNYYVFEMYHRHFGDVLIGSSVTGDAYEEDGKKTAYLSVNASKVSSGNTVYLMVINKNIDESIRAAIQLEKFLPAGEIRAWILNGPGIDATNEVKHDNVKITSKTFVSDGNSFEFTFEPHSLTALEIERDVQ